MHALRLDPTYVLTVVEMAAKHCRANEALKQGDAAHVVASLERSLEAEVNAKVTAQAAVEGMLCAGYSTN